MISKENIVILGAGESGTGAALLAKAKGYNVFVSDAGTIAKKYRDQLENSGINYEQGQHSEEKILVIFSFNLSILAIVPLNINEMLFIFYSGQEL